MHRDLGRVTEVSERVTASRIAHIRLPITTLLSHPFDRFRDIQLRQATSSVFRASGHQVVPTEQKSLFVVFTVVNIRLVDSNLEGEIQETVISMS